jgi:tRNA threonylcarbamoyl adenosine modification protein (Sua5/YciO/YrdC/YwlC family)
MPPLLLPADAPEAIDRVVDALRRGLAVVLPTETVYGVAALPSVPGATAALFALKDRPDTVPLAVLVADVDQAAEIADLDAGARRLAERFWPGPLTLVAPRRSRAAAYDLGGAPDTVGVRCPDHALVRSIAGRVGPIATTSANRHGVPTPSTAAGAVLSLAGEVAVVIDGGPCSGASSTVVDCTDPDVRILRAGPISEADLQRARQPARGHSKLFDRVADRYDDTRGGLERGRTFAEALMPWIRGPNVVDLGVGTGLVAAGLVERGIDVTGVDLSLEMLRRAFDRIGPRVAQGDAHDLPVASGSVDTVLMAWVLHVVGDAAAVLDECRRVLRPGGRLAVIEAGDAAHPDDDVARLVAPLHARLRELERRGESTREPDLPPERVARLAADAGFVAVAEMLTDADDIEETPNAAADKIEDRVYSSLWDIPDATWAAEVEPVIVALRALPDPSGPRARSVRHHVSVFDRP